MEFTSFDNITKSYKNGNIALRDVSFKIEDDQIIGLLGRNGAGKTSLISILMGFIHQTSGSVRVFNQKPGKANMQIGFVPDFPYFHQKETVISLLLAIAQMRKIERKKQRQRCLEIIEKFGLEQFAGQKLCHLSRGILQRFNIAQAVLGDPDLVVMDEPLSGLDPLAQSEMLDLILRLHRPDRAMLISSHLLFHLERICDQVLILDQGMTRFFGRPGGLNEIAAIQFFDPLTDQHQRILFSLGARRLSETEIEVDRKGDNIHHLLRYCADNRLEIKSLSHGEGSLEQQFLNIVRDKK
ncbi:MAG: ABC transporter ATP-binding protein [Thermoleophilia bacterium]